MRILGAATIAMEAFVMGFAILIAMDTHSSSVLALGALIAILMILTSGMMKKKSGWIIGSLLQLCMIAYGFVVPMMFFMGTLFAILWAAAYFVGRKGEAIRAKLIAEREGKSQI
jgi:hypothetical protein